MSRNSIAKLTHNIPKDLSTERSYDNQSQYTQLFTQQQINSQEEVTMDPNQENPNQENPLADEEEVHW